MPEPTPTAPVVTTPSAPTTPAVTGATPPAEEPLGTPGLAALQRERERVAELERTLAQVNARVAEFEQRDLSELDRYKADVERLAGELGTERATRLRLEIAAMARTRRGRAARTGGPRPGEERRSRDGRGFRPAARTGHTPDRAHHRDGRRWRGPLPPAPSEDVSPERGSTAWTSR